MKNSKKKYLLIFVIIVLIAMLCICFAACENNESDENGDIIYPTNWKTYIDDYVELMSNTFIIADDGINVDLDIDINIFNKTNFSYEIYRVVMRLNLSAQKFYNENALVVEVYKTSAKLSNLKIFSLYSDNTNLFLQVYEDDYNKESKYQYTEAPLLDLMVRSVIGNIPEDFDAKEFIKKLAVNTFTDCTVNSDKTVYNFTFNLATLVMGNVFGEFEELLTLLPSEVSKAIYGIIGAKNSEEFNEKLLNTEAVLIATREGNYVKKMEIMSAGDAAVDNKIVSIVSNKIVMSAKPIIGLKNAMPFFDDYEKTKIATLTTFGKISLKTNDKLNTLVTYDLELNMSVDLLKLMLNNGDIECLDEDNYFHLSVSHKCNSSCNDYCSVELGNKFMPAIGSVLDIAFSPSDFGTNNIYLVTSLKSLLGANSIAPLGINANLIALMLSDYQLLTIDTSVLNTTDSNAIINDKNSILTELIQVLNLHLWGAEIKVSNLSNFMRKIMPSSEIADALIGVLFSNSEVGYIDIECGIPQYGAIRTYDIAERALFITSDNVEDGVVGTKQYDNALFASRNLPPLTWEFNDGNYINSDLFINNIYSLDGELLYGNKDGKNIPISPEEVKHLYGGKLKFSYTDIYNLSHNENGTPNFGEARILDIQNIDYNNTREYQKTRFKLSAPTRISLSESRFDISFVELLDQFLYVFIDVNIKLTPIKKNGIVIDRTDKNENGEEITEYRITNPSSTLKNRVLKANATIGYQNGEYKTYAVYGSDEIFDEFSTLLISHMFNVTGDCDIKYSIAGFTIIKSIHILNPDILNIDIDDGRTFRIYDKISLSSILTARINVIYNDNVGTVPNFKINKKRYKIDGRNIADGSDTWNVSSDGINDYIEFYREGIHTITVNYLGSTLNYEIAIVSEYTKSSTYKITAKTSVDSLFLKGKIYNFNYDLDNKTFGNSGLTNQSLKMEIYKLSSDGFYKNATEDEAILTEIRIDNTVINNGAGIDLPAIVYKPIKIQCKINFLLSGRYRLRINIPGYSNEMTVTVNEN